jgi:transcriptional regulator with XRE-family HTH domain
MEQLNQTIRAKRKALNLTLRELSDQTGIAIQNISSYELGKVKLTGNTYDILDAAMDKIIVLKIRHLNKLKRQK